MKAFGSFLAWVTLALGVAVPVAALYEPPPAPEYHADGRPVRRLAPMASPSRDCEHLVGPIDGPVFRQCGRPRR